MSALDLATTLESWEARFHRALDAAANTPGGKAGALLPIIPSQVEWEHFVRDLRSAWMDWPQLIRNCPACVLVLYGGLAFFEYDENTFWRPFANAVGLSEIPATNRQTEINAAFRAAAERYKLRVVSRANGIDSVGSAIYQIGIPVSMWDGFLDICEWALWHPAWSQLNPEQWTEAMERRCGGRTRLRRFLTDNRDAANGLVDEMLQLRSVLSSDPSLTLSIWQASFLREEYLEGVPETADFLRPRNPESLFRDRAQICWDDRRRRIRVMLPGVSEAKLPATWSLLGRNQKAAVTPDEIAVQSGAFAKQIILTLEFGNTTERRIMRGLGEWSLFDLESDGRLVNHNRDELPMRSYALVSRAPVSFDSIEGFSKDVGWLNEETELSEGERCYVTRLWPNGEFARFEMNVAGKTSTLRFRTRARVEARFFPGPGFRSGFSVRTSEGYMRADSLPELCVAIPRDYFRDARSELRAHFRVSEGAHNAGGEWVSAEAQVSADRQLFVWRWARVPFIEKRATGSLTKLSELGRAFKPVEMLGTHTFRLDCQDVTAQLTVDLINPVPEIERCWNDLPGKLLPWFLLSQAQQGLTWEEMLLAKSVIAPEQPLSPHLLRKYEAARLLEQRGRRWVIRESRAVIGLAVKNQVELAYCGDPSMIWRMYRRLYRENTTRALPKIEVADVSGGLPYFSMRWPPVMRHPIREFLAAHDVKIAPGLWTP